MDFSISNIIAGILFGCVGMVAFTYGKKMGSLRPLILGLILIVFPYFISNTMWTYAVGILLTAAIFFP